MNILYIDPIFGLSGDMMISSFLDAGMPFGEIEGLLRQIPVDIPHMRPLRRRQGITEGTHLEIASSQTHLSIAEMEELIAGLDVSPRIKDDAQGTLAVLVAAEAKVHGVDREEVHFHELSHIDTLIDVVSVAKCMHYFGIQKSYCGPVPMGGGTIKISHGTVPNPPPATVELLSGFNLRFLDTPLELTTPTGAAILRYYVSERRQAPPFVPERVGYGFGSYESEIPDALRIFIGTKADPAHDDEVWLLEADVDDMNMEYLGAVADRIRMGGALDVLYFPVYMKKGRIGVRFSVLASLDGLQRIIDTVLAETTTFGVRMHTVQRRVLRREEKILQTPQGQVRVKMGYDRNGFLAKSHIEFEDVKRIAEEQGIPYIAVYEMIEKELSSQQ